MAMNSKKSAIEEEGQEDPSDPEFMIEHPLENPWTFWAERRSTKGKRFPEDQAAYENNLNKLGTCTTVESFWAHFFHILPPSKMDTNVNLSVFKDEIKPMWEDEANSQGGKWVVSIKNDRGSLDRLWEELLLAMIGENLIDETDEICGAVLSRRARADKISLWNKNKNERALLDKIGKRLVSLYPGTNIQPPEYQHHEDSLRTSKSYTTPTRYTLQKDRR